MDTIIGGLFLVNGIDVWTEYGVFPDGREARRL